MQEQPANPGFINKKKSSNGFAQFGFFPQLFLNIMVNNLKNPTTIQKKAIPAIMEGKDLIGCYKTGSGKTLAYLLPMINKLQSHSQIVGARALILLPTRDLAEQVANVLKKFLKKIDLRYCLILGGHTYEGQFESLTANPDIIIATPGRLMQLLAETDLKLSRIQMVVFDEADQLFSEKKFFHEMKEILTKCPISQRMMLSATITEDLTNFASIGLREYCYIHQEILVPETLQIDCFVLRSEQKLGFLLYLLTQIKNEKVIVFASTRFHVDFLMAILSEFNINSFGIYGKMDMQQRNSELESFRRKKKKSILVVTDVAARGLDIPYVKYVLHYDYPTNHKSFVHRSGRTARNEQAGNAVLLLSYEELPFLTDLSSFIDRKLVSRREKECITFGSVPSSLLNGWQERLAILRKDNGEVTKYEKVAGRAFLKFKKCRTEASQNSLRRSKNLQISTHQQFLDQVEEETQLFLEKVHNYTPKKALIELQKTMMDHVPENDQFLSALERIRKEQKDKRLSTLRKERLKSRNSSQWKDMLEKNEIKEFEEYRDQQNREMLPIQNIQGLDIQVQSTVKKSMQTDFKSPNQYIHTTKDPNVRTEFDDLPRIKPKQIEMVLQDENLTSRTKKERVWDSSKKNFKWKRDEEDKMSKEQQGKKAYDKWKKQSKLSIPKAGQVEDQEQVDMARKNWKDRRMHRHGWKENKPKGGERRDLKNNKTKAVEKRFKKKMISKSSKKGGKPSNRQGGKSSSRQGGKSSKQSKRR